MHKKKAHWVGRGGCLNSELVAVVVHGVNHPTKDGHVDGQVLPGADLLVAAVKEGGDHGHQGGLAALLACHISWGTNKYKT